MAVPDLGAVLEGLHGLVAVGAVVAGLGDHAVGDGLIGVPLCRGEVQAGVVARPEAVLAEAGGDVEPRTGWRQRFSLILAARCSVSAAKLGPRGFELLDLRFGSGWTSSSAVSAARRAASRG